MQFHPCVLSVFLGALALAACGDGKGGGSDQSGSSGEPAADDGDAVSGSFTTEGDAYTLSDGVAYDGGGAFESSRLTVVLTPWSVNCDGAGGDVDGSSEWRAFQAEFNSDDVTEVYDGTVVGLEDLGDDTFSTGDLETLDVEIVEAITWGDGTVTGAIVVTELDNAEERGNATFSVPYCGTFEWPDTDFWQPVFSW